MRKLIYILNAIYVKISFPKHQSCCIFCSLVLSVGLDEKPQKIKDKHVK